eukprot:SAG11_NODE_385_length_9888_cov_13.326387_4_plen_54_part_00
MRDCVALTLTLSCIPAIAGRAHEQQRWQQEQQERQAQEQPQPPARTPSQPSLD